jgi:hypothetical protein
VIVQNDATSPVPVSGNVNVASGTVGIDPAHNAVSGTVNVGNLPPTQSVSGTVGIDPAHNQVAVSNFPNPMPVSGNVNVGNLPAVQTVNGTVGIDPANNAVSGTVNVGNLPAVQTVNGTVGISGTVQTGGTAAILQTHSGTLLPNGGFSTVGGLNDTTAYKEVTVYMSNNGPILGSVECIFSTEDPSLNVYGLAQVTDSTLDTLVQTFDPAPPNFTANCANNSSTTSDQYSVMVVGRPN